MTSTSASSEVDPNPAAIKPALGLPATVVQVGAAEPRHVINQLGQDVEHESIVLA
ncbi:hypothetical protein ACIBJC_37645 [Streptomyces sp. NPDC050509]|uniref:hypothetical protein n=1 Tax=Streptomyces sp. NPDC050509 TaxID=3365620 RepID=UPI0037932F25